MGKKNKVGDGENLTDEEDSKYGEFCSQSRVRNEGFHFHAPFLCAVATIIASYATPVVWAYIARSVPLCGLAAAIG